MKILDAKQIRQWDEYTIQTEPISSIDLMERAAMACTNWLAERYHQSSFVICCAKGNNGGDGLAIARQLRQRNFSVKVYILERQQPGTPDFETNLHRLHQQDVSIAYIANEAGFPQLETGEVLIECLFGSGLNRPLTGLAALLVQYINNSAVPVISIDVPAGMFIDSPSAGNIVINATSTLTFECLKLAFLLPENNAHTGATTVLDIGLAKEFTDSIDSRFELPDMDMISSLYKPRRQFSHKGTFGHALIIAGAKGKMGAAILSSRSCLRSGAGLVTSVVPEWGMPIIQGALPEAMAVCFNDLDEIEFDNYQSAGIGPGLGTSHEAGELLKRFIGAYNRPMVIDADALNLLAKNPEWLAHIPPGSLLTPHPKEFERLFGKTNNDFERLNVALTQAEKLQAIIVLKGHYTFIATPQGKGYFNGTGNAGMATAGSGDVLTGILTGLLSQGYEPQDAAILGVFLHGLAGDIAAKELSMEGMLAGDITDRLGKAFLQVAENRKDPWKGV